MTKKELVVSIAGILLLAILSEVMWLYEISVKIGWASLLWLKEDLFSPIGICFCAGTAYILPFLVKHKQIDGKVILTWLSFIFLNITVFYFGEAVLKKFIFAHYRLFVFIGKYQNATLWLVCGRAFWLRLSYYYQNTYYESAETTNGSFFNFSIFDVRFRHGNGFVYAWIWTRFYAHRCRKNGLSTVLDLYFARFIGHFDD